MNGDTTFIWFLAIGIPLGIGYIVYRIYREPQIILNRRNRYILYMLAAHFVGATGGAIGNSLQNNLAIFLGTISIQFLVYFCLCWTRLLTISAPSKATLIVRPGLALWLGITSLFRLGSFLLAGPAYRQIFIGDYLQTATNFWLWLGTLITSLYLNIGLAIFLLELIKLLGKPVDAKILWFRYTCYTFAVVGGSGVLYFGTGLIGFGLLRWPGGFETGKVWLDFSQGVLGISLALIIFVALFGQKPLRFYEYYHRQRRAKYVEQLRWLYQRVVQYLPDSVQINPYEFYEPQSAQNPEWLLEAAVNGLTDVRILLWRAKASCLDHLPTPPSSQIAQKASLSLEVEAYVWHYFLQNREQANKALEILRQANSAIPVVPPITNESLEKTALWFVKLSKVLQKKEKEAE